VRTNIKANCIGVKGAQNARHQIVQSKQLANIPQTRVRKSDERREECSNKHTKLGFHNGGTGRGFFNHIAVQLKKRDSKVEREVSGKSTERGMRVRALKIKVQKIGIMVRAKGWVLSAKGPIRVRLFPLKSCPFYMKDDFSHYFGILVKPGLVGKALNNRKVVLFRLVHDPGPVLKEGSTERLSE